ncbi:MAG: cytochrome c biogenesis protein ResB [Proteobacteria bacterium]|nr:cytochrome c biogenesis protein ResB [Pseudomonadota bacterium]
MKNSFLKNLWAFITSLKLTIIILLILSVTSIIGTIIPQNELPYVYLKYYKPSTYKLFQLLSFDNMYHSWWFTTLLALFTLNLICCSFRRFPNFWRLITQKERDLDDKLLQSLPLKKTFRLKELSDHTRSELSRIVQKHVHKPTILHTSSDALSLFAGKGKYTRLGFFITHLGIALIIIGGIIGNYGYQGFTNVVEGEASDTITLRGTTRQKKLDFSIRCDDFEVSFYQGGQRPKDYKSNLTIIDGGKEVKKKLIEVNDPLYYKGVYIYQSSYGTVPDQGNVILSAAPKADAKKARKYKVEVGKSITLEDKRYEVKVMRFVPDFSMGKNNKVVNRSQEMRNPAVQIALFKDNILVYKKWIFSKFPDFHGSEKGDYRFSFLDFSGKEYTGLQLTKDPGVWVVWSGCFLLTLGCYLLFFMSHQRLWIIVENKKGEYIVNMAGTSNKNMLSFTEVFDQIHQELKKIGKSVP